MLESVWSFIVSGKDHEGQAIMWALGTAVVVVAAAGFGLSVGSTPQTMTNESLRQLFRRMRDDGTLPPMILEAWQELQRRKGSWQPTLWLWLMDG